MPAIDSVAELTSILEEWEKSSRLGNAPKLVISQLQSIAELVEKETESWYKMDPDPFDDRHPGRSDPTCALGHLLKALFKNDNFMNKLVNTYLCSGGLREQEDLHIVSCRLLLDIMPGLETSIIFQENETLVRRLSQWAQTADDPLKTLATGLLAGAMETQDVAANFREGNAIMVPMMLRSLHVLKEKAIQERTEKQPGFDSETFVRPFANIGKEGENEQFSLRSAKRKHLHNGENAGEVSNPVAAPVEEPPDEVVNKSSEKSTIDQLNEAIKQCSEKSPTDQPNETVTKQQPIQSCDNNEIKVNIREGNSPPLKRVKLDANLPSTSCGLVEKIHPKQPKPTQPVSPRRDISVNDCSNSSWAEMEQYVIGTYHIWPLDTNAKQRLILQYLTPMGEYQELLSNVFEYRAMDLIFYYIDLTQNKDVRLAFEATKYLAALLCHKKFAIDFINAGGVVRLLEVYRPSVTATGVSMCLYYLAYFEDAMERVCQLPHHVLSDLVSCVLWLLECSHESGRCHATMFLSFSFPFRVILELFDMQDGLRKLYNVISTLAILNTENRSRLSEDEVFTSRQAARHVSQALKKYLEGHLAIKADQIRRSHVRNEGGSPIAESPAYKAAKYPPELIHDNIELLLECLPLRMKWEPASKFIKLGGVTLLLKLVAMAAEWSQSTGRAETIRSALDVLVICSVTPKTQLLLCEAIELPDNHTTPAISILLGLAEGEILPDPDVQKAALNVINNCVCGPMSRYSAGVGRIIGGNVKRKLNPKNGEDLLFKIWNAVRTNNGIMVLLKLLMIKTPITEADSIRALACKALVGLIGCETVKQIVSKLPLFNNGQLQQLMKEPVLQDKRQEHLKFCRYANELIVKVSGKPQNANIDASLDRIRRADIVAQTKIVYHDKELLQLIRDHLSAKGLTDTAEALEREANLPRATTPPIGHPSSPHIFSTPPPVPARVTRHLSTPANVQSCSSFASEKSRTTSGSSSGTPGTPLGPIKLNLISSKVQSPAYTPAFSTQARMQQTKQIIREKHEAVAGSSFQSPLLKRHISSKQDASVSLDKIITKYLREQHAGCKNPIVTCPPFSLLRSHRCPEPKHRNSAPANISSRALRRQQIPRFGGPEGRKSDRKFVYSRFRPIRSYRDTEEDGCFSCCTFSSCEQYLLLGTYAGELKMFNVQTGSETAAHVCHHSPLSHIETTRDGKLVLTSSLWGGPLSSLWNMNETLDIKYSFEEDRYMEFSNQVQDRIIGTKSETANIYDVTTGMLVMSLHDQDKANNYTRNKASFSPSDQLVLNDGVLWDVNSGKAVHKFDKFNPNVSGIFHPNCLEVIINSEVWDLRTYHLMHTVPALDQCQIRFSQAGDVIYGAIHQFEDDEQIEDQTIKSPFGSSFRTFDATDYSNIATIDVKKNIFDLCTDSSDCYLAVVENSRSTETLSDESFCRLYEVGRLKDEDDDQVDEEEEEEEEEDDDDDDEDAVENDDPDAEQSDDADANEEADEENSDGSDDEAEVDDDDSDTDDDNDFLDDEEDDMDDMDDLFFELSDLSNF